MKTRILGLAALVAAFAGLTIAAFGQLGQTVTASIPFPYIVQGQRMPAGHYSFQRDEQNPEVLVIRSDNGAAEKLVLTESAQMLNPADQSELIFDKIDGKYFLSQIWTAGNDLGWQIPEHKFESRVKKEYAANFPNMPQQVEQMTVRCTH
jgi:hypothetical protein